MSIRRGWLTFMKPSIQDFGDVLQALGKLKQFTENLEDQVLNVRRGPHTSLKSMSESVDLEYAFKKLREEVERARGTARHWGDCYEGKSLSDCRSDGEKMLELYKKNFEGATSGSKKQRGGGGLHRESPLTEYFDDLLKLLYDDARRIKEYYDTSKKVQEDAQKAGLPVEPIEPLDIEESVFREFQYDRMKVVVSDPKAHGRLIRSYVKYLDKAYHLLKAKGFSKLWYGVMFLQSAEVEHLSKAEQAAYESLGYKGLAARAGTYHSGEDIFKLTQPPTEWVVDSIVHELGHRYWFKFMSQGQRAKFESLVKVNKDVTQDKSYRRILPDRTSPAEVKAAKEALVQAKLKVEVTLDKFSKAKGFYMKILPEWDGIFSKLVLDFINEAINAYQMVNYVETPEVKAEFSKFSEYTDALRKHLYNVENLKNILNAMPDGGNWTKEFIKERTKWVAEAHKLLDKVIQSTEKYIDLKAQGVNDIADASDAKFKRDNPETEGGEEEDQRTVLPVSDYGKSHIREAFAEVFTYFVLGKDMNRDQLDSFKSVLSSLHSLSIKNSGAPLWPTTKSLLYSYSRLPA